MDQPACYRNMKITKLVQAVRLSVLPPVVCQVLLQLCYPVQFVEEPLVYGRQLVDLINTHAAVEGLKSRDMKQICMLHLFSSPSSSSSMALTGAF